MDFATAKKESKITGNFINSRLDDNHQHKLYGLDHLRALAIFAVFLFHYFILSGGEPGWLPGFAKFGWTGVDLFFVLSGFLIASQLFAQIKKGDKVFFKPFFLKRFFRIIPAYLVTVGLYFLLPIFREKAGLPPLWKFLTFTQNLGLNLKDYGAFSHAWSLCVEEHFYLFLPVVLFILHPPGIFKYSGWLLLAIFVFGFFARWYSYTSLYLPKLQQDYSYKYWYQFIYYPTYNRLDGLLAGVSLAALFHFMPGKWKKIARYGNLLIILGLMIVSTGCYISNDQMTFKASVFGFPVIAIGYGCMVAGAISSSSFLFKWQSKATTLLATLSYSIYLTHKGVIHMTHNFLKDFHLDKNLLLLFCMLNCLAFAFLLNLAIEKPFMRLRKKVISGSGR